MGFLLDTRIGLFTALRLLGLGHRPVLRLLGLDRSELGAQASGQRPKLLTPAEIAVAANEESPARPAQAATRERAALKPEGARQRGGVKHRP
jgi:hypothetical protein